jgi:beta-glucosidase
VQLYIRDLFGSVTRPVKELKGFKKVFIEKGNSVEVSFKITASDLSFYDDHMNFVAEPGEFVVMVGTSSAQYIQDTFVLTE